MKLATATESSMLLLLVVCLSLFFARSCEAASRPAISIERAGTNVIIRFTGALQSAGQAQGPFRPVPGARSPWVVPAAGAGQEFWRAWMPGVQRIAAGEEHTVALRADGTLWAWGGNYSGQLGIGTLATNAPYGTNTPQRIGSDTNWQSVAAGLHHSGALRTDGTLWTWGLNENGQLGVGTFTTNAPYGTNTPQRVGTDANWQAVAAGYRHTVALRTDGTLWAWGRNNFGQLGIGTFTTNYPRGINTPQQVGTDTNWLAIAAGGSHTVALRTDGTLWAWGRNYNGELGIGTFSTNSPPGLNTPQQVGTDTNWQAIATASHTVALRADGTLWTWGWNSFGQLGIGTFTTTNTPQRVGSDTNWQAIAASTHTVALRADGTLWAWGWNEYGQLGIGTFTTNAPEGINTPQQIGSDTNWQAAFGVRRHTVALRTDGTLWAWGGNSEGQLGIGTFDTNAPYGTNTPQQVGTNAGW